MTRSDRRDGAFSQRCASSSVRTALTLRRESSSLARRQGHGVEALYSGALEVPVRPRTLYRVASVLLLLFTFGHTVGFQQPDPAWGVGAVVQSMQSSQFTVQGFTRTYWDFFLGAGFTVGALYLFAAVLAWQLGGLPV